jgi:hypothetical protein
MSMKYIVWAEIAGEKKVLTDVIETGTSQVFLFASDVKQGWQMPEDNAFITAKQVRRCDDVVSAGYAMAPLS